MNINDHKDLLSFEIPNWKKSKQKIYKVFCIKILNKFQILVSICKSGIFLINLKNKSSVQIIKCKIYNYITENFYIHNQYLVSLNSGILKKELIVFQLRTKKNLQVFKLQKEFTQIKRYKQKFFLICSKHQLLLFDFKVLIKIYVEDIGEMVNLVL